MTTIPVIGAIHMSMACTDGNKMAGKTTPSSVLFKSTFETLELTAAFALLQM